MESRKVTMVAASPSARGIGGRAMSASFSAALAPAVFGLEGLGVITVPSACTRLVYRLELQSPDSRVRIVEFAEALERSCYTTNTLRRPVEVVPELTLNGVDIPLG